MVCGVGQAGTCTGYWRTGRRGRSVVCGVGRVASGPWVVWARRLEVRGPWAAVLHTGGGERAVGGCVGGWVRAWVGGWVGGWVAGCVGG